MQPAQKTVAQKAAEMNPVGSSSSAQIARDAENVGEHVRSTAADLTGNAQSVIDDVISSARRTIHDNPTLAIAGMVALGAVAVLVVRNRVAARETGMQRFERNMSRQVRALRRAVRQELRDSSMSSRFDGLGDSLASMDLRPYIRPLLEQAADMAGKAKTTLSQAAK